MGMTGRNPRRRNGRQRRPARARAADQPLAWLVRGTGNDAGHRHQPQDRTRRSTFPRRARPNPRSPTLLTTRCPVCRSATCGSRSSARYGATPGVNSASTSSPWPVWCSLSSCCWRRSSARRSTRRRSTRSIFRSAAAAFPGSIHSAPTRWDATSWPECCGVAASRWPSASSRRWSPSSWEPRSGQSLASSAASPTPCSCA